MRKIRAIPVKLTDEQAVRAAIRVFFLLGCCYGAGISVYTHVVARGNEVVFAKNTPMEIRFGTHAGSASLGGSPHVSP